MMQKVLEYVLANAEENNPSSILETIENIPIKYDRKLDIYTWGIKKHEPIKCDIVFDATLLDISLIDNSSFDISLSGNESFDISFIGDK